MIRYTYSENYSHKNYCRNCEYIQKVPYNHFFQSLLS